jgi:hypothetical protein
MLCDCPGCTGVHSSNSWANLCPAARDRKRQRQANWVRRKYQSNRQWAENKLDANRRYWLTPAGFIAQVTYNAKRRVGVRL